MGRFARTTIAGSAPCRFLSSATSLSMGRFFDHADPRRLDDLLALKLSAYGFGRDVKVDSERQSQLTLHFTSPERPPQTCSVFSCPATRMRYFYSVLPIEKFLMQDRPATASLGAEASLGTVSAPLAHTQLAPAVCRLVASKIMLFDGQHKSAGGRFGPAEKHLIARSTSSLIFDYSKIPTSS